MNDYDPNEYTYAVKVRKSTEAEERQIQSIERQKDDLNEIIDNDGLDVYGEIIEETKSAFHPGREKFQHLIDITEKGYVNAWLCWHPNRLSRNALDSGMIIHLMDIGKLYHIRTPSRIYFNTPSDKLSLAFEFILSKKDSDDKSVFVKSGLKKRYKKGLPTGKAALGFLNDKTREKGDRKWIVDEDRLEMVGLILNRFLKGMDSISSITDYARNDLKLTTPVYKKLGGRLVCRSYIEHLLKNPIYAGFFHSLDEDSNTRTRRDLDENLPRVISVDQHNRILQILSDRNKPKQQVHDATFLQFIVGSDNESIGADFKFQLVCDCGHKFAYRSRDKCPKCDLPISKMRTPKYLSYIYYYNIQLRKTKGKIARCIEEKKVTEYLRNYIHSNFSLSDEVCEWAKRHIHELQDQRLSKVEEVVNKIDKDLQKLTNEKSRLRSIFSKGHITEEEFTVDYARINNQLEELRASKSNSKDYFYELEMLFDLSTKFERIIEKGTLEEKKKVLRQFGSNLIWDEEKLEIVRPKWLRAFEKGRKHILAKYEQFEPKKSVINKGRKGNFENLCPSVLRHLDDVRTYLKQADIKYK